MNPRLSALGRLAIFVILAFVVFPAKKRWLRAALHDSGGVAVYIVDHLVELAAVLTFAAIMARLERRSLAAYGLPWRAALRSRFWQGAGAGIGALTLLYLGLAATGALHLGLSSGHLLLSAILGIVYALLFVLLAVREEFLYRGYGMFTGTQIAGFWFAAVASTAWFTWSHSDNSRESPLGLANVALFALVACLMLRRTGDLWMPIGFHAAWDWGQTYLYGVGDSGHPPAPGHLIASTVSPAAPAWLSGGLVGPEGSVLCTALIVALGIVYASVLRCVRYPERDRPPTPEADRGG